MLNNEQLLEDILDIHKKTLHIALIAPYNRVGLSKDAISYLKLPLPPNYQNPVGILAPRNLKFIRLAVLLGFSDNPLIPSCLIFSFESTCGGSYISDISNHDMQNYHSDIRRILTNNYSFKEIKFEEDNLTKDFITNFEAKRYSIEEVKTILYVYSNPITFKDNYLQVIYNNKNCNCNYSIDVGLIRLYFHIGLNYDETKCITRVYWDSNLFDKDFSYLDLQSQLNGLIYYYMPQDISPS